MSFGSGTFQFWYLLVSSMSFHIASTVTIVPTVATARKGRQTQAELVHAPGPLALAMLVGDPHGRWNPEVTRDTTAGRRAMKELTALMDMSLTNIGGPMIAGLALIEGWRFVREQPSTYHARLLLDSSLAFFPRRNYMKLLEHTVVAFAPWPGDTALTDDCSFMPPHTLGRFLLERLKARDELWVTSVLDTWSRKFGNLPGPVAWQLWWPLALLMARGSWQADVSVKCRRHFGHCITAPCGPSDRLLRYFMALPSDITLSTDEAVVPGTSHGGTKHPPYPADLAMSTLSIASRLRSQRDVSVTLDAVANQLEVKGHGGAATVVRKGKKKGRHGFLFSAIASVLTWSQCYGIGSNAQRR